MGASDPPALADRARAIRELDAGRVAASMSVAAKRILYATPLYSLWLGRRAPRELLRVPPDLWPGDAALGAEIVAGRFTLGGQTVEGAATPWEPAGAAPSFLEALHGFEWLRDLRAAGGDQARRQARRLIAAWIDRYDRWHPLAWRPDILGLRLASWLGAHDFFCLSADDAFRQRVFQSVARQTRHLVREAAAGDPIDPRQIHVAKGLIASGLALPQGKPRLDLGRRLLVRAVQSQILPDGGHIRRNPAALLTALRHLVDVRATLRVARADVPEPVSHAIDRMGPALRFFRHGDGGFAMFNDAQEGVPVAIDAVLAQAASKGRPLKSARHSGFERLLTGRTLILADIGAPAPPGADEGAHAGLLAFEMSVGRERLIVNCGAWAGRGGGENAAWHTALRGTPAHSTLSLAGQDSAEIASGGGLRRRPRAVESVREETDIGTRLEAAHDAWAPHQGIVHRRCLALDLTGDELSGEDHLHAADNRALGLPFAIRFHLHPTVQVSPVQSGQSVLMRLPGGAGWRLKVTGFRMAVEESVYVSEGTERRRSMQAVIWGEVGYGTTSVRWTLRRDRRIS